MLGASTPGPGEECEGPSLQAQPQHVCATNPGFERIVRIVGL